MNKLRTKQPPTTLLGGKPYTSSLHTDIRQLFARVRLELYRQVTERKTCGG